MAEKGGYMFITDLPDHLIHDIMLLLDSKGVASFTAASKKLMQLWVTSPTMKFSTHGIRCSNAAAQFENYVLKSLSMRPRTVDHRLHKLCLSWNLSRQCNELFMHRLMEKSEEYGVEELLLDFKLRDWWNDLVNLCPSLLNLQSLRKLDVAVNNKFLMFPITKKVLDSLETLNLSNVELEVDNFQSFISKSCPNLKYLSIHNFLSSSPLVIKSPSLVKLFINGGVISDFVRVDVLAPQLKTLVIDARYDGMLRLYLTTPSLKTMFLDLHSLSVFCAMENMTSLNKASVLVTEQFSKSVLQQLGSTIQVAEHLTVSKPFIKKAVAVEYENYWPKLKKVSSLVITTKQVYDAFYGYLLPTYMASFLDKVPYLKHLRIEGCPENFEPKSMRKWSGMMDAESWEFRNLEFIRGLRTLQLEFCGTKDEVEFLNYVLRNASALEKCVVKPADQCRDMREMLDGIDLSSPASPLLCVSFI